jgi:hypothetical protein
MTAHKKPDFITANDLTNKLAFLTYRLFIERDNKELVEEIKKQIKDTAKAINKLYSEY